MAAPTEESGQSSSSNEAAANADGTLLEEATFGSGCFWCTEAVYQQIKGVQSVVSGYCGGYTKNPTYQQVCTGETGHAEVVRLTYDPKIVSYKELVEVFFAVHDPTTKDRQGADIGTQYRSAIFFHNDEQKKIATETIKELDASGTFNKKIVTEISPVKTFYPAEDYHQNFFRDHPNHPNCQVVIRPKLKKLKSLFKEKVSDNP
jgi:peptide-methionine (S)-S-oxide reductase